MAHPDLAGYAVGGLEPHETAGVATHVAACARCRDESERLRRLVRLARDAGDAVEPPPDLADRVLAAVRGGSRPVDLAARRRPPLTRIATGLAAAAVLIAGTVVATRAFDGGGPGGRLELDAELVSVAATGMSAEVSVRDTGLGRTVALRSDTLPILPKGEFYELWFVAPGDAPGSPRRISAGTFHPDAAGRTHLELHAAVDPALYPAVSVTAERGDGDPAPGAEVLRGP